MRWRQYAADALPDRPDPDQPLSPWRNHQTIGISEAFTFVLDQRYSQGDYLWKFTGADDLWLGCWGLIRVRPRGEDHPLLPLPLSSAEEADAADAGAVPAPPSEPTEMRRFRVVAEHRPVVHREYDLIDPFGIVFRLAGHAEPGQAELTPMNPPGSNDANEPDYPYAGYRPLRWVSADRAANSALPSGRVGGD